MAKRAKKRLKKGAKVGLSLLLVLIIVACCGSGVWISMNTPVTLAQQVSITVDEGAASGIIAEKLQKAGVIKSATAFKIYLKQKGAAGSLKPGNYSFEQGEATFPAIVAQLKRGTSDNTLNVTIPEGYTVEQIAAVWESKGLVDSADFLDYCANGDFPYDYLPKAGNATRLEGFLFPETYNVLKTWGAKELVNLQLKQFDKEFTAEMRAQAQKLDLSVYEITTLASIIEREARVASDRPLMSSVFHSRLALPMRLQSCATVQYALGEVKPVLSYKDLEIASPYNTYQNDGLPPGPIGVPGRDSLHAALYPADSDYLFFVVKPDGSHAFSKTYEEHMKNVKKYSQSK